MGKIVELAIYQGISALILLFFIVPTAILFLAHLVYIIAETIRELRGS